jgi:hypothetical protein
MKTTMKDLYLFDGTNISFQKRTIPEKAADNTEFAVIFVERFNHLDDHTETFFISATKNDLLALKNRIEDLLRPEKSQEIDLFKSV